MEVINSPMSLAELFSSRLLHSGEKILREEICKLRSTTDPAALQPITFATLREPTTGQTKIVRMSDQI